MLKKENLLAQLKNFLAQLIFCQPRALGWRLMLNVALVDEDPTPVDEI